MATVSLTVVPLWDLAHGQQADCFAILASKEKLVTKKGSPYLKCQFQARHETRSAMIWSDHPLFPDAASWETGIAYRLINAVGENSPYGPQVKITSLRPAGAEDEADGYCFNDLVQSSDFSVKDLWDGLREVVEVHLTDPCIKTLIKRLIQENRDLFAKMPAAESLHHAYTSGLLEHVWSLTRICVFLADHYRAYY